MDRKRKEPIRKDNNVKLQSIYSRCLLTKKVCLPITMIGSSLDSVIEECIRDTIEGKCIVEGFVKPNSSKVIRYSCGTIERGTDIVFEVQFECDICFPVEGMSVSCVVKNIVKAGIRAESSMEMPSPFVVFIPRDHLTSNQHFNDIQVGDTITARIIGQRFELNDKMISIIGELKDHGHGQGQGNRLRPKNNKPKITIN